MSEPTALPPTVPDGVYLVVIADAQRYELPIELPRVGGDEVAAYIRDLNADALWKEAMAGADATVTPGALLLELVARHFDE